MHMTILTTTNAKILAGLLFGFLIGLGCAVFGIPSPAPPVIIGALLVVSMTVGWILTDRAFAHRPSHHAGDHGGPTGQPIAPGDPTKSEESET